MKRIGPELKMPDLKNAKVPPFLSDLYYDLHDRRLLPLVGLVLVAIVAVPFLLGGGSEEEEAPPAATGAAPALGAHASSLTVVEAQPGLRDYRKRLAHRQPTDPFKQRFTGASGETGLPDQEATGSGGDASETSSSPTPSSSGPATEAPPSSSGNGGGGTTGSGEPELRLFTFAVDVKIVATHTTADGKKDKSEPEVRKEVIPPAPLPSGKSQAVTYMGISPKTKKPLFLVSDDVEAIYGEPKCISGSEKCQLLEVDLQMPTTFVYEPTNTRFKINVLKVEPVLKGRFEG